ncbi:Uncharacterized protein HI_1163 [Geodia barretti]|uniref:Uncharacterized protein HI_1163 n=1 Tax=Geodia barretti TaxID=519541 RepID=A0AA35WV93_GEOBA|nr:Uncharacterized protein HI_1163 [Geodia barretti]
MEAMQSILECNPTAVELIDKTILDMARRSLEFSRLTTFIQGDPAALLAVEFYGETQAELESQLDRLEKTLKSSGFGYALVRCFTAEEKSRVWETRKAGLGLLMGMKGDAKPVGFVEDAAVPIENLPEYVRRFDEIVTSYDTTAAYYAHASVGLLHNRPIVNLKSETDIQKMHDIAREVRDLLMELDGAMSGEHGDGLVRSEWIESMFGPQVYQALAEVKKAFDPNGIMNPGKIVDAPSMTENLRFGTEYNSIKIDTYFDFSSQDGFGGAIEMCNGVGACRKTLTGTMCPSFIGTREEEHSTRGRANALRSIISGALPHTELTVNNGLSKWFAEKLIGIDRRRDMPTFVRPTYDMVPKRKSRRTSDKKVVLFSDTFMNYSEPSIGKAAVELLEACGFEVLLPEKIVLWTTSYLGVDA